MTCKVQSAKVASLILLLLMVFGTTTQKPTANQRPYQPTPGSAAEELLYSRDQIVFLSGPAGTGKSRAALEKVHICCLKYPGMRAVMVRKTRKSLTESGMITFQEKVLPVGSPVRFHSKGRYEYPNGSVIIVGGLDDPGKVMSTEYDLAYVQEGTDLNEEDLEALDTRMRNGVMPYQQIIGDCNPQAPTHWLKRKAMRGDITMLESRHQDNPVLWDRAKGKWTPFGEAYIGRLEKLTGARKLRLKDGIWAAQEGMVYENWDPAVHLVDASTRPDLYFYTEGYGNRICIPPEWPRYRVIDFGFNDPFVCQWWALNDGVLYLYREIYVTQSLIEDCAALIQELSEGENIVATIPDHDRQERETLKRHGVPTIRAKKSIMPGIQAVQARMRTGENGQPRLLILRDCLVSRDTKLDDSRKPAQTIEEFDGYVWAKGPGGLIIKEKLVDADNHGMDTMRYMVAHLDFKTKDTETGGSLSGWLS